MAPGWAEDTRLRLKKRIDGTVSGSLSFAVRDSQHLSSTDGESQARLFASRPTNSALTLPKALTVRCEIFLIA